MLFRRASVNSIIENVRFSFLDGGRTSSVGRALNWRKGGSGFDSRGCANTHSLINN